MQEPNQGGAVTGSFHRAFTSQYRAGLAMLRGAIASCPEELWDDASYHNRFWHIAYHVLFYTHLYLSPSEEEFAPWEKGRADYNFFPGTEWSPFATIEEYIPYTKNEILEYHDHLYDLIPGLVGSAPFEAPSGFFWIPFDRFQLHIYTIRHLGHHTGQLSDRIREGVGNGVAWVGRKGDV